MTLSLDKLETDRFGFVCAKFDGQAAKFPDLALVNREARNQGVALISARIDVGALDRVHALEADGYRLMDTLVFYGRSLRDLGVPRDLPDDITFRLASPEDAPATENIARLAFQSYFGHYHADPGIANSAADAVYTDWAKTSVIRSDENSPVLVALWHDMIVGFATIRVNTPTESEVVLNAIHPEYKGRGLYGQLIRRVMEMTAERKAERLVSSTQINNYVVQRAWTRLGFTHERSLYTFHKWMS